MKWLFNLLIITLMTSCGTEKVPYDISGEWSWISADESSGFGLYLTQENDYIYGRYCAVAQNGMRSDCWVNDDTIPLTGKLVNGVFEVDYTIAYSGGKSTATITYNADDSSLTWVSMSNEYESYTPTSAKLFRDQPREKEDLFSEVETESNEVVGLDSAEIEAKKFEEIDIDTFVDLFEEKEFADFHVYSIPLNDYEDFKGSKIDTKYSFLFRNTEVAEYFSLDDKDYYIFSTYKISLSDTIVGLIIRHYGMYAPNQVSIFFLDKVKKDIVSSYGLARHVGDEGNLENTESWIRRLSSGELFIYSWTITWNTEMNEFVDELHDYALTNGIDFLFDEKISWQNPEIPTDFDAVMKNNPDQSQ